VKGPPGCQSAWGYSLPGAATAIEVLFDGWLCGERPSDVHDVVEPINEVVLEAPLPRPRVDARDFQHDVRCAVYDIEIALFDFEPEDDHEWPEDCTPSGRGVPPPADLASEPLDRVKNMGPMSPARIAA